MNLESDFEMLWDSGWPGERLISAIHGGNAGDIVYSLPAAQAAGISRYVLNVCTIDAERSLTLESAQALVPLLLAQPYIKQVSIVRKNIPLETVAFIKGINFIFDRFRLFDAVHTHLAAAHARVCGAEFDLTRPWLHTGQPEHLSGSAADDGSSPGVVLALTSRYRIYDEKYWQALLSGLSGILFLGLPQDYDCASGLSAELLTCRDMLQMAQIVGKARLFLGNQSLPYAIAEGLKVPRVIECFPAVPNAYPLGGKGHRLNSSPLISRALIDRLLALAPQHPHSGREQV